MKAQESNSSTALSRNDLVSAFDTLNAGMTPPDRSSWELDIRAEANFWRRQFEGDLATIDRQRDSSQRNVANLLPADAPGKRVLHLGCGPFPLKRDDMEVTGADPLAEDYKEMLRTAGCPVPEGFIASAGETLQGKIEPGSFDYVLSSGVLEQSYDPAAFIAGCRIACRPGGTIILHCRNLWDPINNMRGANSWNLIRCNDDLILWREGISWSLRVLLGNVSRFEITDRNDGTVTLRAMPAFEKNVAAPDYATIYDAVYSGVRTYTASHTSPGLRTALSQYGRIMTAGPRHLDVGAGPGYLVEVLSMPPFRKQSRGVDISAVAVAMANERLKPGLVQVMKQGEIPFADNSFDLITCFDVMEHLEPEDVRQLMREIRRVAAPKGVIMLNISLRDSSVRDINGDSVHRSILKPGEWDELIGFDYYSVNKREYELLGEIIS